MSEYENVIRQFYEIKNTWSYKFHGIEMSRVMIFEMYSLARTGTIGTPWKWLRIPFHTWNLSKLNFSFPNYILSTFGQQDRKDHKEVYTFVTKVLGDAVSYNDLNTLPRTFKIRPWLVIKVILTALMSLRYVKVLTFKQKLRLSLYVCNYCNALLDLEKLPLKGVKKYLSMYQANQLENMITQYMKIKGIPTYSLCEGVYIVDKQHLFIDSINYTNLETEHLLVWGEYVIDEFTKEGISRNRMTVCGYPHHVDIKQMKKGNQFNKCFVLLARRDCMDADMRLLQILSTISDKYKFYLKAHPNSDIESIEKFANENNMEMIPNKMTINECMYGDKFDWGIAVNTTAYYEALMRGVPCLRYDDGSYSLLPGIESDRFNTINQLEACIHYIQDNIQNGQYQNDIDHVLKYVMGIGINKYRDVLLNN